MFTDIQFTHKTFFWLLIVIPVLILWYFYKHKKQTAVLQISNLKGFEKKSKIWVLLNIFYLF